MPSSIRANHVAIADDLPDAVRAYVPDPAMRHRGFVPKADVERLRKRGAPRAEIERLCALGGWTAK
jgi:hypothetical protein